MKAHAVLAGFVHVARTDAARQVHKVDRIGQSISAVRLRSHSIVDAAFSRLMACCWASRFAQPISSRDGHALRERFSIGARLDITAAGNSTTRRVETAMLVEFGNARS